MQILSQVIYAVGMPAAADCERVSEAFLSQPANALSSLAFVLAGAVVAVVGWRRVGSRRTVAASFAVSLALVGLGSFAFHGPGGRWADWAHDASITVLCLLVLSVEAGRRRPVLPSTRIWGASAFVAVAAEAGWERLGDTLNAFLAGLAFFAVVTSGARRKLGASAGLAAAGVTIMLVSRTGGPWCDPDSMVQGHAVWHVLATAALTLYAVHAARTPALTGEA